MVSPSAARPNVRTPVKRPGERLTWLTTTADFAGARRPASDYHRPSASDAAKRSSGNPAGTTRTCIAAKDASTTHAMQATMNGTGRTNSRRRGTGAARTHLHQVLGCCGALPKGTLRLSGQVTHCIGWQRKNLLGRRARTADVRARMVHLGFVLTRAIKHGVGIGHADAAQ